VLQRLKSLVDTFLAEGCICARFRRIGDGPDLVHLSVLGKQLLKLGGNPAGHRAALY
jgi:acyl-CoA dehydrogenase